MRKERRGIRQLNTIIHDELNDNETIFITTDTELNDVDNPDWWKMKEFKNAEKVFEKYNPKTKVKKFWHEDGLCIILNK